MTIHHVGSTQVAVASARHQRQHAVGEQLELKVLRRVDGQRYLVSFQDAQQHVVSSTVPLDVGATVRAVVTAVGEKLELRYVASSEVAVAMEDHAAVGEDTLAQLATRYSVALQPAQRAAIEQAAEQAEQPDTMIEGGMFLSKLALPVDHASLQAVYSAQRWSAGGSAAGAAIESPMANAATMTMLAEQMMAALQPNAGGDRDSDGERDLAQQLLNEQDEGSVAYSFGVLPVLIGDQLLELDLVHFRERRREDGPSGMRRLVMTFSTPALGRVEVLAQALGDRLTIGMVTDSPTSREILAARSADVRELLARLGWSVEAVSYEYDADVSRAARRVLTHVLDSETLSRWV